MTEPTRAEHIAWCKRRALAYLEPGPFHSVVDAGTSLVSDLYKHEETLKDAVTVGPRCFSLLASGADVEQMRAFIEAVE